MTSAGYVGHTESWTAGMLVTIPGGVVILAAFALARAADRADGRPAAPHGYRAGAIGALGWTLLSGAVMVLAGYALAAWGWIPAAALATVGGVVIAVPLVLGRTTQTAGR